MNTDASTETPLSAELEKAAKLLEAAGLDHAAAQLLAPEEKKAEKTEEAKAEEVKPHAPKKARKVVVARKAASASAGATATKAKKKHKVKAAPKARTGSTGQSGPQIDGLTWNDLNKKERLLVGCFDLEGDREVRTIDTLAEAAFKSKAKNLAQANSWARNSLRRLMRSGKWLEKVEPGKYRLTAYARKMLAAQD